MKKLSRVVGLVFLVLFHMDVNAETSSVTSLSLNEIQIIGSHNSFKKKIDTALLFVLELFDKNVANSLDYAHLSLAQQLDLGLRSLELDIYYDSEGGLYQSPMGNNLGPFNAEYDKHDLMSKPGFKVLHVQDVDYRSQCLTFIICLQQIKSWSDRNPKHLPLIITINPKDDAIPVSGFLPPIKFSQQAWDDLDDEFRQVLPSRIVTPDKIKGEHGSLRQAVLQGWPSIKKLRGKILFVLDAPLSYAEAYILDYEKLSNRVMFVDVPENTENASFRVVNDPIKDQDYIKTLVKQGFIVRTRADADTKEARSADYTRLKAALTSGAQIISTDYYKVDARYSLPYKVKLPEGGYFRCNPLITGANCTLVE